MSDQVVEWVENAMRLEFGSISASHFCRTKCDMFCNNLSVFVCGCVVFCCQLVMVLSRGSNKKLEAARKL